MKTNILMLILELLSAFANNSKSQTPCPPSFGDQTWPENPVTAEFVLGDITWGGVGYYSKGGITVPYEIKVDWTSLSLQRPYRVTDEEYKRWMRLAIIKDILDITYHTNNGCSFSGTKQFIFYEEAACKVNKVCYYELHHTLSHIKCKDDYFPENEVPAETTLNSVNHMGRLTEIFDCGTTSCCVVTYTMECVNGSLHIAGIATEQLEGSECPEGDNVRCKDNAPMPCTSNCNQ
jgi:hypothetical protein